MADQDNRGRRFLVVGAATVYGVRPGGELWEGDLVAAGVNVGALIAGGHLREVESKPAPRRKSAGEGDE